jgi:hypothetical protein
MVGRLVGVEGNDASPFVGNGTIGVAWNLVVNSSAWDRPPLLRPRVRAYQTLQHASGIVRVPYPPHRRRLLDEGPHDKTRGPAALARPAVLIADPERPVYP